MNKNTWIAVIVIILVILGGWYYQTNKPAPASGEPIKIGFIGPLTGDLASLGENSKNGVMLALQDLEKANKKNIEVVYEDDRFDPKTTVTAFNKLVDVDQVKAIICLASGPCGAVAPIAEERKVPLIAVASAPVQLGKQYVVKLEISPVSEGEKIYGLIKEKKYEKPASIVATYDGIQIAYNKLKSFSDFSSKEIAKETIAPDSNDFRTSLTKILSKKPDVIIVGLLPGMAGEFGKQARTLGYNGDFIGFNFIEGEETLTAAGKNLDGIVYTQAADPETWFAKAYQNKYGKSTGPGSAHLYDAVTLLSEGFRSNPSSADGLMSYLKSVKNFKGALGEYSSTADGEFSLPLIFKTIKDGQFIKLEE
jgi:branched-chain amino acid transport system substrate-binding protein